MNNPVIYAGEVEACIKRTTPINYKALALKAMNASIKVRMDAHADFHDPICIYGLCETLGATVRFNDINMEGMYEGGPKPRIHLSSLRPLVRRNFTCAHELGHHIFGHGSTIDALKDEANLNLTNSDEYLVDSFASFLLMPTLGMREAFAKRGLNPNNAEAEDIFRVSSNFGVGYTTLINHLAYSLQMITPQRAKYLLKSNPKKIRQNILENIQSDCLVFADQQWNCPTLDCEIGTHIILPKNTTLTNNKNHVMQTANLASGDLFQAEKPGIVRAENDAWAAFIRISRKNYAGLAKFRHLEEEADE